MTFEARQGIPWGGYATYLPHEYSVSFVTEHPFERGQFDSALALDTLTLLVRRSDGRVALPEGYFPRQSWSEAALETPVAESGALFWDDTSILMRGGAVDAAGAIGTKLFDPVTQWLRIETPQPRRGKHSSRSVEFCTGVIAQLQDSELTALWIQLREI